MIGLYVLLMFLSTYLYIKLPRLTGLFIATFFISWGLSCFSLLGRDRSEAILLGVIIVALGFFCMWLTEKYGTR